jgi:hypothetical protein
MLSISRVNNVQIALERIRETIQLDPSLPWTETLSISYPEVIDVDVNDDLNRELALYVKKIIIIIFSLSYRSS